MLKERYVLFNDAFNMSFYLWLYDVKHKVKDHSNSDRRNLSPLHVARNLLCVPRQSSILRPLFHQLCSTG